MMCISYMANLIILYFWSLLDAQSRLQNKTSGDTCLSNSYYLCSAMSTNLLASLADPRDGSGETRKLASVQGRSY